MPAIHRVALVFDLDFGEKLLCLSKEMHVWVCDSPANTSVAKNVWAHHPGHSLEEGATTFKVGADESKQALFARILDTMDLHHGEYSHSPPWSELRIYGVERTPAIDQVLREYGVTRIDPDGDHLMAARELKTQ